VDDFSLDGVQAKISSFIDELKDRASIDGVGSWKMLSIADQTFDAMQGTIARQKLAAYPPDHTIMIARDACGTLEFDRADEMISLGFETAKRSLGM
jgi:NTE family protein